MNQLYSLAGSILTASFLVIGSAQAVQVTGSSGGSFSNLTSCNVNDDCRLVTTGNGTNTQVQWGSTSRYLEFFQPSTLTSQDTSFSAATFANDVTIARLNWYNSSTVENRALDSFGVTWTLSISFTAPNASSDTEPFSLTISNPSNPTPDSVSGFTLADLSNLSFSPNGVTISDLKYVAIAGSALNGSTWTNPEGNSGSLLLTADFSATAPVAVPEPASLALVLAGLTGLGALRRHRG